MTIKIIKHMIVSIADFQYFMVIFLQSVFIMDIP